MNVLIAVAVLLALVGLIVWRTLAGMAQCASDEGSDGCLECAAAGKPGPRERI